MTPRSEATEPLRVNSGSYSERPPGFVFRGADTVAVLHCDDVPLTKLAKRYGTPLYVYSATTIHERLAAFDTPAASC